MKVKLLLITLFLSTIAFSQESSEVKKESIDETTLKIVRDVDDNEVEALSGSGLQVTDYLRVVFILIFVIAVLYYVLRLIKKVGGTRVGVDNDQIKVLSTKALKGTTALHLVEVGSQIFLIGATDSSINPISEITDKETKDSIVLNSSSEEAGQSSFIQLLTEKLKSKNIQPEQNYKDSGEINTQKEKLDRF